MSKPRKLCKTRLIVRNDSISLKLSLSLPRWDMLLVFYALANLPPLSSLSP